ncbi:hypothetical protein BJX99DRAFT_257922 [Aspergillus californicus]
MENSDDAHDGLSSHYEAFAQNMIDEMDNLDLFDWEIFATHNSAYSEYGSSVHSSAFNCHKSPERARAGSSVLRPDRFEMSSYSDRRQNRYVRGVDPTNDLTLEPSHIAAYFDSIDETAKLLAASIACYQPRRSVAWKICEPLPGLLREFSLSIGAKHVGVMAFLDNNNSRITAAFKEIILDHGTRLVGIDAASSVDHGDGIGRGDNLGRLRVGPDTENRFAAEDGDTSGVNSQAGKGELKQPWAGAFLPINEYTALIRDTPAYRKLLADIRCECLFDNAVPEVLGDVREAIYSALSTDRGRGSQADSIYMTFKVDWDPIAFAKQQGYHDKPDIVIHDAITLTGTSSKTQAVTCAQYLQQAWPITGQAILGLIQDLVRKPTREVASLSLEDHTLVDAEFTSFVREKMHRRTLFFSVTGHASSIVEVAEILAWMGSALRSSPYLQGFTYSRSVILCQRDATAHNDLYEASIDFTTEQEAEGQATSYGQCWRNLFRNPLIVQGYRIPRRPNGEKGLEIPLKIMADLSKTSHVHSFAGGVFMKGFSTVLVPTARSDLVPESCAACETKVSMIQLESSRHFLGWCSEMKLYAGAADAQYDTKNSNLPGVQLESPLSNMSIYMGQLVRGGPRTSIGRKDIPTHVGRHGYAKRLKWVKKRFVLLWDEETKRGWLINGATALLHVVRASLEKEKNSEFAALTLFDSAKIKDKYPYQPRSAGSVLSDKCNLQLTVYADDDEHVQFRDQVTRFYEVMEKMIDYQSSVLNSNSEAACSRLFLEGWDFDDVANERDPTHPRAAAMGAKCYTLTSHYMKTMARSRKG